MLKDEYHDADAAPLYRCQCCMGKGLKLQSVYPKPSPQALILDPNS